MQSLAAVRPSPRGGRGPHRRLGAEHLGGALVPEPQAEPARDPTEERTSLQGTPGTPHTARQTTPQPARPATRRQRRRRGDARCGTNAQTDVLLGGARSAICVQRLDDSLNSAIHTRYRSLLRSSSMHEPRGPPLEVVFVSLFFRDRSRNGTTTQTERKKKTDDRRRGTVGRGERQRRPRL